VRPAAWALATLLLLGAGALQAGVGPQPAPPPDLPSLGEARLTLPWGALEELLEGYLELQGKQVETPAPPVEYVLSGARYQGGLEGEQKHAALRVRASYELRVLARGWVQVPLFPAGAALASASLDGRPAPLTAEDPRALLVEGPGAFRVEAELAVQAPQEPGENEARLPIPETADAQLELELPARLSEVAVEGAVLQRALAGGGRARYRGALLTGSELVVRYTLPAENLEEEVVARPKAPPKVYATVGTLVSIEEASVRSTNLITFSVREAPVTSFSVQLPQGYALAEVSGAGIQGQPEPDAKGLLKVPLGFEVAESYQLKVVVDRTQESATFDLEVPVVEAVGVEHQSGKLGVQVGAGAEVQPKLLQGVFGQDPSELPPEVLREARNPISLALGYRKPGYKAVLAVARHAPMPVLDAAVDLARVDLQLTADGKAVARLSYLVRNQNRQFMRVGLPPQGQVWSAHVHGRPVKPALSESQVEGAGPEVLVPLERSARLGSELEAFEVELTYFAPVEELSGLGRVALELPRCDLPASRLLLGVYVPEERFVLGFGGDLRPLFDLATELLPDDLCPFVGSRGGFAGMDYAAPPAPPATVYAVEEQAAFEKKKELGRRDADDEAGPGSSAGLRQMVVAADGAPKPADMPALATTSVGSLPARFQIPQSGPAYRFERLVLLPGAGSRLELWHAPRWLGRVAWVLVWLGAALFAWLLGRHAWRAWKGERRLLREARALGLLAGGAALVAVPLLLPLRDYPLWWGLWTAVLVWALRQVLLRGWPFRPLARWWRARRAARAAAPASPAKP